MGDYPSKQAHSSVEVTDQIFVAAIQEEVLRDEIYCQIMKQLTENRNRYSPKFKQPASIGPRVLKCRWWSENSATPVVGWGQTEGCANGLPPSVGLTFSEHSEPLTGTARPWSGTIIHLPSAAPIIIHCSSLCTMARKVLLKPFFVLMQPVEKTWYCRGFLDAFNDCSASPPFVLSFPMTIFPFYKHVVHTKFFYHKWILLNGYIN